MTLIEPYCPGCAKSAAEVYKLEKKVAEQVAEIKQLQAAMADIVDCSRKAIHTGDYVTSVSHIFHVAANATGGKR